MAKALDLTNQKFGNLTALYRVANKKQKTYWLCQCDCGNQIEVQTSHLRSGTITSCGCLAGKNISKVCQNCGIKLHKAQYKYCSNKCQKEFENQQKLQDIFLGNISGLKKATNSNPKISDTLREFLLKESNYKCQLCGWGGINPYSGKSCLEIHHIDGNRQNNLRENLQVLCPNCHSLTPNFRSLNKKK